jgi:hypothetical protein
MIYTYILGCAIAFLCMTGIESMDTVDAKFSDVIVNTLLWPVALCKVIARNVSMHNNHTMRAAH